MFFSLVLSQVPQKGGIDKEDTKKKSYLISSIK